MKSEKVFREKTFPGYDEPFSGKLSEDLRFKGPSPQDYISPFSIYEPILYSLRDIRRLDFDEDRTRIQCRPGIPIEIPEEAKEYVA